jgi:archaeosortase A (PGF-CTERM-specific)
MEGLLWIALLLFIVSSLISTKRSYFIGSAGWLFFAAHWASLPTYYIHISDFFNVILTILVAIFCAYVAFIMLVNKDELTLTITKAAAIGGIFYFSFAEFSYLNYVLRETVTSQTVVALNALGIQAIQLDWNVVMLNNHVVEIILGCTGIESMALLLGIIACAPAPRTNKFKAFLVSVPVVYILNIVRNGFVITASGYEWFGPSEYSFYIAHNVLAKFGSIMALIVISYLVFKILPELLDLVVNVFTLLKGGIQDISERF